MIHHKTEYITFPYPAGEMMDTAIKSAKEMCKGFLKVAEEDIPKSDGINLVCMGSSGAMVATIFYQLIRKKYPEFGLVICHIKKEGEISHHWSISDTLGRSGWMDVFVDDFSISGETVIKARDTISGRIRIGDYYRFKYVVLATCRWRAMEKFKELYICEHLLTHED